MTRRHAIAGAAAVVAASCLRAEEPAMTDPRAIRLPVGVPPDIGCWFWADREFDGERWREFLDEVAVHAHFGLLTTSIRYPEVEVTDEAVHARVAAATAYAARLGMRLVMDLDVRLARRAFQQAHPAEMQEMLRCREVALDGDRPIVCRIEAASLSDHYTFRTTPYISLAGRLARVWRYGPGCAGAETVEAEVLRADAEAVEVAIAPAPGRLACVAALFEHLTPDVFAPHLPAFERAILERYSDVPLAGACKDEWGFPPDFDDGLARHDLWYSPAYEAAYQARTGRGLLDDALLLTRGPDGPARDAAVVAYMELGRERCAALEDAYYQAVKAVWGAEAVVATHPTWFPWPGRREAKKNGLDWWQATRDLAQTDEVTPIGCRTALAKKWGSPVWYNMYYDRPPASYHRELWSNALAGGRINVHPPWPTEDPIERDRVLLRGGFMHGMCRVRLLNFISSAPLDCPVAVLFGHRRLLDWAGSGFGDSGWEAVAGPLWQAGFPTDLLPTSELPSLVIRGGAVCYGSQVYRAVVVYEPEFEGPELNRWITVATASRTRLLRWGAWTRGADGRPRVSPAFDRLTPANGVAGILDLLADLRVEPVTPAEVTAGLFGYDHIAPPRAGIARLLDGTRILVRGVDDPAGDPITGPLVLAGQRLEVEATGLLATRFSADGRLEALAAGGLRRFAGGGLELALDEPCDLALLRAPHGWRGVLQSESPPPPALLRLTSEWRRLALPVPLAG